MRHIFLLLLPGLLLGQTIDVPRFPDIRRLAVGEQPSRDERQSSCYIFATEEHPVAADGYIVVTDHDDPAWLKPLERLAAHRDGAVHRIPSFRALGEEAAAREELRAFLAAKSPRFVALAPRLESYGENSVLATFSVLRQLDADPALDVFPGWLLAPDAESFAALIEQGIAYAPPAPEELSVFTIAQVIGASANGLRSWQKAALMHQVFERLAGGPVGSLTLRTRAGQETSVDGLGARALVQDQTARGLFASLDSQAVEAIEASDLLFLFGHGAPGMVCSTEVGAFAEVGLKGKIVLCGSCFSAAPPRFDFGTPGEGPDGSEIDAERERFLLRAVEQGAVVAYGHMRLNGGFPQMFAAVESWMRGSTLGEGYQRQLNRLLAGSRFARADAALAVDDPENAPERAVRARNGLLYIVVGDPALQPLPAWRGE